MSGRDPRPLVVHVLHRFDTGGLENGVVNLINHLPHAAYRHVVIALTEVTDFRSRIQASSVECIGLQKPPGHGARIYPQVWSLLRRLRPAIVHTRNLAALEMQPVAWMASVPVRIHGEHGRDVDDLDGSSRRHQFIRRLYSPYVHRYVALSRDLASYLTDRVGIASCRIQQIYNGVDAQRFAMAPAGVQSIPGCPFYAPAHWLVGTVGRMQPVKHQTLLVQAFMLALRQQPALRDRMRLVMVGDGPLRAVAQTLLIEAGLADLAWLPGERADVPAVMRGLHAFVLPSLAEGVSNTILEAMASGLPVLATRVGGNAELVQHGQTGLVVPGDNVEAMAKALCQLAEQPQLAARMGVAGRSAVDARFSMQAMVDAYHRLYSGELRRAKWAGQCA